MITGPLSKAAAEELEELWERMRNDGPWGCCSYETIAELEKRSLQVCGLFVKHLIYGGNDETYELFDMSLRERWGDMEFNSHEMAFYYGFWLSCMMAGYEGLMKKLGKEHAQTSLDWYRVTMLEVAEQMRNIKLERIAADKAKKLGIDTDSKAYSNLLKIMRTDLDSHISVTKQSVRASVHGTLGRTGKAYLQKWKDSQKQ